MRNIYLIDFENVGSDGLSGILNLSAEDRVIIFYSTKSNRLTMRAHILIGRAEAQFTYYEATVGGKNALDHQLSTYLGYLIGTNAAERYYIVSRDNGYRFASNFWNGMLNQTAVFCIDNIKSAQRVTEKLLRRTQEETTLRTADDFHDEDLEEGTGAADEATEEPATVQPASAVVAEVVATAPAPEPEAATEATAEPANRTAAEEAPEVAATVAAEEIPAALARPVDAQPDVQAEPQADSVVEAAPAEEPDPTPSTPPAEEALATAEPPAEASQPTPAPEILFPENPIDDVPDPNRPSNHGARRPYRADNNRRYSRKPNGQRNEDTRSAGPGRHKQHSEPGTADDGAAENPAPAEEAAQNAPGKQQTQQGDGDNREQRKRRTPQNEHPAQHAPVVVDEAWLSALLLPYPKLSIDKIREMIIGRKKQILCNALRKQLGQEKGLALYSEIKKTAWK